MTELKFDTEGITFCQMNEMATAEECAVCKYRRINEDFVSACIYEDKFPELKDLAGLEDCIYIRGTE